jgi:neurotransmitter:Na+ symporter, NSS family
VDSRAWGRKAVSMAAGLSIFLLGILSAFSYNLLAGMKLPVRFLFGLDLVFFETLDKLASNLLLPLGGLLMALYVGWRMNRAALEAQFQDKEKKFVPLLVFLLKYVATVLVGVVFLYGFAFTHTLLKKLGL